MTYGVRILPAADAEVDEAALFIADDSLEASLRFYDAADRTYRQIGDRPEQLQVSPTDQPRLAGMRKCALRDFPNYIVFYPIDADMVEIVRVLHGASDIAATLSEGASEEP